MSTDAHATVSIPFPTPGPVGLVVIHNPPRRPVETIITRVWADPDRSRCGLCPAGRCGATHGACTVVVPGLVEPRLAAGHRIT